MSAPKKEKGKRLTPAERSEACEMWGLGEHTVGQLAAKFGVTDDSLYRLFKQRGISRGAMREEVEKKRKAALMAALTIEPEVHARRIFETKNETYRIIEMLRKLVAAEVVKARQEGKPLGTIANDMKAIKEAASAIKICREEAYAVLGITEEQARDEHLPTLDISGLTDAEIETLQNEKFHQGVDAIGGMDPLGPEGVEEVD